MIALTFIEALLLTEIVEIITALVLGYRGKKFYIVLVLINIITNPTLNYILIVLKYFHIYSRVIVPPLEVLVIISEWKLFEVLLGKVKKSYFFLSLMINLSSYLIGLICYTLL